MPSPPKPRGGQEALAGEGAELREISLVRSIRAMRPQERLYGCSDPHELPVRSRCSAAIMQLTGAITAREKRG